MTNRNLDIVASALCIVVSGSLSKMSAKSRRCSWIRAGNVQNALSSVFYAFGSVMLLGFRDLPTLR